MNSPTGKHESVLLHWCTVEVGGGQIYSMLIIVKMYGVQYIQLFCIKGAVNFGHLFPFLASYNNHLLNWPLNSFISSWSWNFLERFKNTMLKMLTHEVKRCFHWSFIKPTLASHQWCNVILYTQTLVLNENQMKSNAQSTFQMPCCNLRATHFCGERIFFTVWLTSFGILLHLDPQLRLPDASCSPSHYFMFPHLFSSGRLWVQCECFESWSPSSPTRAHCRVKWTRQHQFPVFIDKKEVWGSACS